MDQILTVLLTTEMFVGGCLAFILDNTVPGMGQPWDKNKNHGGLMDSPPDVSRAVARSDAMQALQGEAGIDGLEGETTGLIEAKFPLGLEEDVARRVIPGPHELFPFHFLVATGLRSAFVFLE